MGFPRQEYWSGLPFPPPEDLPNPGLKLMSLISPTSCISRQVLYHWATREALWMIIALLKSLEELPFIGWSEDHRTHFATLLNLAGNSKYWRGVPCLCSSTHHLASERAEAADRFVLTLIFWENLSFCRAPNVAQWDSEFFTTTDFQNLYFLLLFLRVQSSSCVPLLEQEN